MTLRLRDPHQRPRGLFVLGVGFGGVSVSEPCLIGLLVEVGRACSKAAATDLNVTCNFYCPGAGTVGGRWQLSWKIECRSVCLILSNTSVVCTT